MDDHSPLPLSGAQRQAAYRQRREEGEGDRRLNTWISTQAHFALERMARRTGVTKRGFLEACLIQAENELLKDVPVGSQDWEDYFSQ